MKKILTMAVAVFAMASTSAMAAENIKLSLGGFMKQYVGVINHDASNVTSNSQWSNTEVNLNGSTVLDNGLTVAVAVQLLGDVNETSNDISSLTISGDAVGAFTIGGTAHAADDFATFAPIVGEMDSGKVTDWVSFTTARSANDFTALGNNGNKVKYVSPTFSGYNAFASYDFNENTTTNAKRNLVTEAEAYTVGLAFNQTFNGTAVVADLSTFRPNGGVEVNRFGTNLTFANNITVGGSYSMFNDDQSGNTGGADGNAYDLGVGYETGPWSVSATYSISKSDGTSTAGSNEDTTVILGGAYDLGAGVALTGNYFDAEYNPEGAGLSGNASGVIAGIEVSF